MYKLLLAFFLASSTLHADVLFDKIFETQFSSLQHTQEENQKFLILFSGASGSGKTLVAKRLEERFHALRFSSDEAGILFTKFGACRELLGSYLLFGLGKLAHKSPNHLIILDATCDNIYSACRKFAQDEGFQTFLIRMDVEKEVARGRAPHTQDFERSWTDWQLFGFYNRADFHFPNNGNLDATLSNLIACLAAKIEPPASSDALQPSFFARVAFSSEEYERIRREILTSDRLAPAVVHNGLSEILPGLYIGSQWGADNRPAWISNVLTVTNHPRPPGGSMCIWKSFTLADSPKSNISQYFEEAFGFIENTSSAIIVHCKAGGSRSPTIVISYLMKKYNVPFEAAWKFVRKKNPRTGPNRGFIDQLKAYERTLKNQSKEGAHAVAR
jgi:hypothetical protein